MKHRKVLLNLLLGLFVLAASITAAPAQQGYVPVPPEAEGCVDYDSPLVGGAELLATEVVDGTEYLLIFTYHPETWEDREYPAALLVSVASGTCESLLWNTPGALIPYADYVPMAAAISFRQIEYERQIQMLGGDSERFANGFDLSDDPLLEEEAGALERLGILDDVQGGN